MLLFNDKTNRLEWTKYKTEYLQQFGLHAGDIVTLKALSIEKNLFGSYDIIAKKLSREDQRHWAYKDYYPNRDTKYEIIGIFEFDPEVHSSTNDSEYKYIFAIREMDTKRVYLVTNSALQLYCSEHPHGL